MTTAKKPQHLSFLRAYKTLEEAERFANIVVGGTVVLHLYHSQDAQLFAVCDKASADCIAEIISSTTGETL